MQHIELASGDKMPGLGLGTWKMNDGVAFDAVKSAIENGYRHIDCAWIYENEKDVGRAIGHCLDQGIVKREELWVTSKLWNDRHLTDQVADALKGTLADLKLDYLDLYLIHWPVAHKQGVARPERGDEFLSLDDAPLADTWNAMLGCVDQGLCRNVGVSNFSQANLELLIDETGSAPACNQVESHPLLQQNKLFQYCNDHQIAFTAYSPLGSGDRPDGMKKESEPNLFENEVIMGIASQRDVTPAQVLLAWSINRGAIPIPKSSNADRQRQNLDAASIQLTEQEMKSIATLDAHYRYVDGKFWEVENGPYSASGLWDE